MVVFRDWVGRRRLTGRRWIHRRIGGARVVFRDRIGSRRQWGYHLHLAIRKLSDLKSRTGKRNFGLTIGILGDRDGSGDVSTVPQIRSELESAIKSAGLAGNLSSDKLVWAKEESGISSYRGVQLDLTICRDEQGQEQRRKVEMLEDHQTQRENAESSKTPARHIDGDQR